MSRHFLRIGFTLPYFPAEGIKTEAERIVRLLESDLDFMHIRKPGADIGNIRLLIESIPEEYHNRLRIHDHFILAHEFSLAGIHLNGRNPIPLQGIDSVTRSCHSIAELSNPLLNGKMPVYQTLSPVFDSISKPGYLSNFRLDSIREDIKGLRVVALGGVTPDKFDCLRDAGFIGAAMLGCLWK